MRAPKPPSDPSHPDPSEERRGANTEPTTNVTFDGGTGEAIHPGWVGSPRTNAFSLPGLEPPDFAAIAKGQEVHDAKVWPKMDRFENGEGYDRYDQHELESLHDGLEVSSDGSLGFNPVENIENNVEVGERFNTFLEELEARKLSREVPANEQDANLAALADVYRQALWDYFGEDLGESGRKAVGEASGIVRMAETPLPLKWHLVTSMLMLGITMIAATGGAAVGALLVSESVSKEIIKAAVSTFITTTAVLTTEKFIDRWPTGNS